MEQQYFTSSNVYTENQILETINQIQREPYIILNKFPSAREKQIEAIHAILNHNTTFISMPTSSGKTYISQLLPLLKRKLDKVSNQIVFIISPLLQLINSQVNELNSCFDQNKIFAI